MCQRICVILNQEKKAYMWVGIDWNDTELLASAATVYMKEDQWDDDTKGRDSATPTVAKSKSPPVISQLGSHHDAALEM